MNQRQVTSHHEVHTKGTPSAEHGAMACLGHAGGRGGGPARADAGYALRTAGTLLCGCALESRAISQNKVYQLTQRLSPVKVAYSTYVSDRRAARAR